MTPRNTGEDNLRRAKSFQQIAKALPVRALEEAAECPHETEKIEPFYVGLSTDLDIISQHGRQQT